MNKRLLAGLMAFCLAAGAANAAFAEDPPLSGPLHTEIATSETAAPAEPTPVPPGPAEEDPAGENATGDELYTPTPSRPPPPRLKAPTRRMTRMNRQCRR